MTRKTTNTRAKASSKGGKAAPVAAQRAEDRVNATETPQDNELQNPEWWRNEGGSCVVQ